MNITNGASSVQIYSLQLYGKNYEELSQEEQYLLLDHIVHLRSKDNEINRSGQIAGIVKRNVISEVKSFPMKENHHEMSNEFKELGYLSPAKRTIDYWPQDTAKDFSSRPSVMYSKKKFKPVNVYQGQQSPSTLYEKAASKKNIKKHETPVYTRSKAHPSPLAQTMGNFKGTHSFIPTKRAISELRDYSINKYDYNEPGMLTMAHRKPHNLIGKGLRNATRLTQQVNVQLMKDQNANPNKTSRKRFLPTIDGFGSVDQMEISPEASMTATSKFPMTTNQDFHTNDVFDKARTLYFPGNVMSQRHVPFNKRMTELLGYANAKFNNGVYVMPRFGQY